MTEHDRTERLMRDLDGVIRGDTPLEDDALLDTARTLLDADFSAEIPLALMRPAAFTKGQPQMMSRTHRTLRALMAAAAVFIIAGAAVLTIPPLRALAQDILRQIGIVTVTDAPTFYELAQRSIPAIDLVKRDNALWRPASPEAVESDVLWIARLEPMPETFRVVEYGYEPYPDHRVDFRVNKYSRVGSSTATFSLNQMYRWWWTGKIDYSVGGAQTEEVRIDGIRVGVWVTGFSDYPELDVQLLIWRQPYLQNWNALTVWLKGTGLSKEQMIEIAKSVEVPDPREMIANTDPSDRRGVSPAQLAAEVGFNIAVPLYVSEWSGTGFHNIWHSGDDFVDIESSYSLRSKTFSLRQIKVINPALVDESTWRIDMGDTPVEDVTVNGSPGIWISNRQFTPNTIQSILIWEQNGSTLQLSTARTSSVSGLTREDMLNIAESIIFIGPESDDSFAPASVPQPLSVETIASFTKFAIAVPDYVPNGYELYSRDGENTAGRAIAKTTYINVENQDTLVLLQAKYVNLVEPDDLIFGDSQLRIVAVNQRWQGLWGFSYPTSSGASIRRLVWENEGIIYRLESTALEMDEMLQIAASLKYVGSPN